MKRNLATAFFSVAGGRALVLVISAAMTPLLVRILKPGAYGQYATLMAMFGLLMILVSSGINEGVRKYILERTGEGWKGHVFGFYFRVAAGMVAVAALALAVAAWSGVATRILGPSYEPIHFYLLALLAVAAQFRSYLRRTVMGLQLEHISEPLQVLHKFSFAVLALGLAAAYGITGVLVGEILASALVFALGSAVVARHVSVGSVVERTPEGFPRRELLSFNHQTIVYFLLLNSLYHVDVLMLGAFSQRNDVVGFYRAALVLVQFLWFVPKSLQGMMVQSVSNLWAEGNVERITEIATRSTRYTLLVTMLLALGLAALARDFVPLYYGQAFAPAVLPILLLLPGTVGFALARPVFAISHAKGEMHVLIAATGGAAVINLGLNAVLIPEYGMVGAAIATSVGYGTLPIFHVLGARRMGYEPLDDTRLLRVGLTTAVAAVPIFGLAAAVESPWVALAVVPPVGLCVYTGLALATGALDLGELFEIGRALPAPIDRKVATLQRRIENREGLLAAVL